jgi:hypothetical protein
MKHRIYYILSLCVALGATIITLALNRERPFEVRAEKLAASLFSGNERHVLRSTFPHELKLNEMTESDARQFYRSMISPALKSYDVTSIDVELANSFQAMVTVNAIHETGKEVPFSFVISDRSGQESFLFCSLIKQIWMVDYFARNDVPATHSYASTAFYAGCLKDRYMLEQYGLKGWVTGIPSSELVPIDRFLEVHRARAAEGTLHAEAASEEPSGAPIY